MLTATEEAIVAPKGYVLGEKLLVLPDPEITETAEGVVLPQQSRIRQRSGTVVVSNNPVSMQLHIPPGTRVAWLYQSPASIVIDDVLYHLMTLEEIAFIFPETREII
jgi:co-chaperonin GroES (HSP10)